MSPKTAGSNGRLRRLARDLAVECFAWQGLQMKLWEFRHFRRFLLWLLFHLEKGKVVISRAGPAGQRFPMRLSWQAHMAYVFGIYEPNVVHALERHLKEGDTCIDVGGHVGYLTIIMSHLVGPRGRVVTFEPVRETFEALEENVRLNGLQNVVLERAALGEREVMVTLFCQVGQQLSSTPSVSAYDVAGEANEISVPALSLDTYVQRTQLHPNLIKIDVEGAEMKVLQGARQTLRQYRPVVLVEIHDLGGEHRSGVLGALRECGYVAQNVGGRNRELFYVAMPEEGVKRLPTLI